MTEQNYSSMRAAMVDSQLRTSDVDDQQVVTVMSRMPREQFLPVERRAMAYIDRPVPLPGGRALNPPLVIGRLLKEAKISAGDRVLLIGGATGYSAALLTELGAVVTLVEEGDLPADLPRVTVVRGPLAQGAADGAPYDLLFIDGAVEEVPAALVQQIVDGGRVVCGLVERGVTRLCEGRLVGGALGLARLSDMEMVVLPGFAAPPRFEF